MRGLNVFSPEELEKLIKEMSEVIEHNAEDPLAHSNLGWAFAKLGDYDKAIEHLICAIRYDPKCPDSYCELGEVYSKLGRFDEAIKYYDDVISFDNDCILAFIQRGNAHQNLGNAEKVNPFEHFKQAITDFSRALELDPSNANVILERGRTYKSLASAEDDEEKRKEYLEEALTDYNQRIELVSEDQESCIARVYILLDLDRTEDATQACSYLTEAIPDKITLDEYLDLLKDLRTIELAIIADPENPTHLTNHGITVFKLGRMLEAIDDFTQAISINPNVTENYGRRGQSLYNLFRFEEAIDDFTQAMNKGCESNKCYYSRAHAFMDHAEQLENPQKKSLLERAKIDMTTIIERDPTVASFFDTRALLHHKLEDNEAAIQDLTSSIQLNPDPANSYFFRGFLLSGTEKHQQALDDFTHAIIKDPKNREYYVRRIATACTYAAECKNPLQERRLHKSAITDLTIVIGLDPNHPDNGKHLYDLGMLHLIDGNAGLGVRYLTSAERLGFCDSALYCGRVEALLRLNQYEEALKDITHLIDENPENDDFLNKRGHIHIHLNQNKKALADFTCAIELCQGNPKHHLDRGCFFLNQYELEKAMADFTTIIDKLDYNFSTALSCRAQVFHILGKHKAAIADLNHIINAPLPQRWGVVKSIIYCERGIYYSALGDQDKAIDDYRLTIKYNSKSSRAYANLGLISLDKDDLQQASEYIHTAYNIENNDSWNTYCLGRLSEAEGNIENALELYGYAIELVMTKSIHERYIDCLIHRALLLKTQGRYDKALRDLNLALEWFANRVLCEEYTYYDAQTIIESIETELDPEPHKLKLISIEPPSACEEKADSPVNKSPEQLPGIFTQNLSSLHRNNDKSKSAFHQHSTFPSLS